MTKKLFACLLSLCLLIGVLPTTALAATEPNYGDVNGHWAEEYIKEWSGNGIFEGDGSGNFNPAGELTRAEAATIFMRLFNLTEVGDISGFTDVDPDAWYAEAIAKCVAAGIMQGDGNGHMNPTGKITREEFFVMFARALGLTPAETCDKEFSDGKDISSWALGYINALVNMGAIGGMGDGTMAPAFNIDRASVAALLSKAISDYITTSGTVEVSGTGIVIVAADNVKITNAPAGTVIIVVGGTNGVSVNGQSVAAGETYIVPETSTGTGGGGGGGTTGGSGNTGGGTTGGGTTGGGDTGGDTTGGDTTGGGTTGGGTTGGGTTGGGTTGGGTTGGGTTDGGTTDNNNNGGETDNRVL